MTLKPTNGILVSLALLFFSVAAVVATPLTLEPTLSFTGPGLTIAEGGQGLSGIGNGTVIVMVDVLGPVEAAVLYWAGRDRPCTIIANECVLPVPPEDQVLDFDGNLVSGTIVGSEGQYPPSDLLNIGYRADVTAIVQAKGTGTLSFMVSDGDILDLGRGLDGVGLLVIYTDPLDPLVYSTQVFEGMDFAFGRFDQNPEAKVTSPIVFTHGASDQERTAELILFTGDTSLGRPDRIDITDGFGSVTSLTNQLIGEDGVAWDTLNIPVTIPVGGATTTVQVFSTGSGNPDSLLWEVGALRVPEPCSGRIGDFVWHDLDRDGVQDAGEPGLNGVTVVLNDDLGNPIATTTTSGGGFYEFNGLCAGDYQVDVDESTVPAGFFPTDDNVGDDALDSDSIVGLPVDVTLPFDESVDETIDFGFQGPCSGTLGDFVWHDLNRNGLQDGGEPGLDGVTVNLQDAGMNVIATTISGPDGAYEFMGLCAGDYFVDVDESTLPPDFVPTDANAGDDALDSDSVGGAKVPVNLPTDDSSDDTIDFGFQSLCTATIGDYVWHDENRNGLQDIGEPVLDGVTVNLQDAGMNVIATTTSGPDGFYEFTGLCLGDYFVDVDESTLPPGFFPTDANAGNDTLDSDSVDGAKVAVNLPFDDSNDDTIDFGFQSPCTGVIGDYVWRDDNQNGLQDGGEPGIDGATVELKDGLGNIIATTTTSGGGFYEFTGLCAGDYFVDVDEGTLPAGLTPTLANAGDDALDSDSIDGNPVAVNLPTSDTENRTIDFGFHCTGVIGDYVWRDDNQNGLQDGDEPGIEGVTVNLQDADMNVIATTVTLADGSYEFTGLCAGDYFVDVDESTVPAGMTPTLANAGDDALDSDSVDGAKVAVNLPANDSSDDTIDFGFHCTGVIGDFVWDDENENGLQDGGEPGIGGVTVNLQDADMNVIATTVTLGDGSYEFTGLCAGDYFVDVDEGTLPPGFLPTDPNAGDDALDSDSVGGAKVAVSLPANDSSNDTIDFGFFLAVPEIDIEKLTNGNQADGANDGDVPVLTPGTAVTWTYLVTNNGNVPFAEADVTVTDDVPGVNPVLDPASDDGNDGILSPLEVWTYEAQGTVLDLPAVNDPTIPIVPGCDGATGSIPGSEAYENMGTATVPGDSDEDPSHYCNPAPQIDIEKLTNGNQADGANDGDVPVLTPGTAVTWTYLVTNTGTVSIPLADVTVADNVPGVNPVLDPASDVGSDGILSPLEIWTYEAQGTVLDLPAVTDPTIPIVPGCDGATGSIPGSETYENMGTATVPGDSDEDPSHYCNPGPQIDIEKLTNGNQADGANDGDVPVLTPGTAVTWTYLVSNTGTVSIPLADVTVADNVPGVNPVLDPASDTGSDGILSPLEVWTYEAQGTVLDLPAVNDPTIPIVPGCDGATGSIPGSEAYENMGTATVPGDSDEDPSHYCNPGPQIDIEKLTNGNQADGANDGDVPVLTPGTAVTWTYLVSNTGTVSIPLADVTVTDNVPGVNPVRDPASDVGGDGILSPLEVWSYEAQGTVLDLSEVVDPSIPIVPGCDGAIGGVPGSEAYENTGVVIVPGDSDSDPSHYCNPPVCELTVEKTCQVIPNPQPFVCADAKPLDVVGMIWNGTDTIRVKAWKGDVGSTLLADVDPVVPTQEVTVSGFAGSPNDVTWEIFFSGTSTPIGESVFHLSCSDDAMDGPEDCTQPQGNGKDDDPTLVNDWALDVLSGNGLTLDCTPAPPVPAEACQFVGRDVNCDTVGNPDNLTWQYTGGGCAATDNDQEPGKHVCTESGAGIDGLLPATMIADDGTNLVLDSGEEFTLTRSASQEIDLFQASDNENNVIHVSCSQPLQAGDVYGSLTLVALDGQRAGSEVNYFYEVTNLGAPVTGLTLVDTPLGPVGGPIDLGTGDSESFMLSAVITETTTNLVDASGLLADGATCEADDSVTVTVTESCDECSGGTTDLTFKYLGSSAMDVVIYDDSDADPSKILFQGLVFPGDEIAITALPGQSKFNNAISIYVDGVKEEEVHTSCSQPIGPGLQFGDFLIVEARSVDNGLMCPLAICEAGDLPGSMDCNGICDPGDEADSPDCDGFCDPAESMFSVDCDGMCDPGDVVGSIDCDGNCDPNDGIGSADCDGVCDPADAAGSGDCIDICLP